MSKRRIYVILFTILFVSAFSTFAVIAANTKITAKVQVNYYKDAIGNFIGSASLGEQEVGSTITGIDQTLYAPSDYVTPGLLIGDMTVQGGIVNAVYVVYTKSANPLYPVLVAYYKDNTSRGSFLGTVELADAPYGSTVTNIDLTKFAPSGYDTPGTIINSATVTATNNVIYVVYTGGGGGNVEKYPVYVEYYLDSLDGEHLGSDQLPDMPLGSEITGVDLTKFAPDGYSTPGKQSGATIVSEEGNTVYVVYKRSDVVEYPVYVEYYLDSLDGEHLGSDQLPDMPFGSDIIGVDLMKFAPEGYTVHAEQSGATIVSEEGNIVYVVYTRVVV